MRSLRRFSLGLVLVGLWATSAAPMLAADNGTVDAQVTVATPCITIDTPIVDFGTRPFSANAGAPSLASAPGSYTNCSTSSERIFGRGTDASGTQGGAPVTWALSPTVACGGEPVLNQYELYLSDLVNPAKVLSLTDQQIEVVASGDQGAINTLALIMPCSGSDGVGSVMSFQYIFTATF